MPTTDNPIDIRTVSPEEYWKVFEKKWTSLLSYRYLGRVNAGLDTNEGAEQMLLRHDMRNTLGGVMVAPLCIFTPEAGGMNDDEFVPNPVIASMQILDEARGVKKLRSFPETVRLGRQMGFSRTLIVDDDDHSRVVAISEGMGISLGGTPGNYEKVDNPSIAIEDSPDLPPLHQVFGAYRSPEGVWRLPVLSIEMASPDAALHLGPQHIVLETAAIEAATALTGTDRLQAESYHCQFAARGKVGPFRATAVAFRGTGDRVGVRLTLNDEGNEDRAVTSASLLFRIVD
ncbi:MAG TPA: hypothetical protein VKQ71_11030 [Acidimicrobiales bacterium]|nr:hypothetical protein [Acidimicrobiales bacterium]